MADGSPAGLSRVVHATASPRRRPSIAGYERAQARRERRRLYRVGRVVGQYIGAYQFRRQHVLMNVPPAIVRHLRFVPHVDPLNPDAPEGLPVERVRRRTSRLSR